MDFSETMTAGLAAADKVIAGSGPTDLRGMLAAAWMLGMAQGGFEALTQLKAAVCIENARKQPQVLPALHLLHVGYEYNGLQLDLYGEYEKFGEVYIVQDACLTKTTASLEPLLSESLLTDMSDWCDRNLREDK